MRFGQLSDGADGEHKLMHLGLLSLQLVCDSRS